MATKGVNGSSQQADSLPKCVGLVGCILAQSLHSPNEQWLRDCDKQATSLTAKPARQIISRGVW